MSRMSGGQPHPQPSFETTAHHTARSPYRCCRSSRAIDRHIPQREVYGTSTLPARYTLARFSHILARTTSMAPPADGPVGEGMAEER